MISSADTALRSETGAIAVTFVLFLATIMALGSFAIDVSNLFRHKRQLQLQADAAVLAGGSKLQPTAAECSDSEVLVEADKYAGISTSTYNKPTDPTQLSRTTRTYVPGACAARALEAEVVETNVPFFFPMTRLVAPAIRAKARVELKQILGLKGSLPIAVQEDPKVKKVLVDLIDEAGGTIIATKSLTVADDGAQATTWSNSGDAFSHNVTQSSLGFRVRLSTSDDTECASSTVECYDASSADGLLHVHGFEQIAADITADSPPALENVTMTPSGAACDANANGAFTVGTCTLTVKASIDWVTAVETGNEATRNNNASVTAHLGGDDFPLEYKAASGLWEGTTVVGPDEGPAPLTIDWIQKAGKVVAAQTQNCDSQNNRRCEGVFRGTQALGLVNVARTRPDTDPPYTMTPVHRTFSAVKARSGPILFAKALEGAAPVNSVARCATGVTTCTHNWVVQIGLPAGLKLGTLHTLKTSAPGSNDGHLDCDPPGGGSDFEAQIATGCKSMYKINQGEPCPSKNDLPASPKPWSCVISATGEKSGPFSQGMNQRIYGGQKPTPIQCSANRNRWPNWDAGEKRIVAVMIVRPPSLDASGNAVWPVKDFAYFYVTGWGDNGQPACNVADSLNDPAGAGELKGYFIKYAAPNDGGIYGTATCDTSTIGGCVPVMTK